MSQSADWAMTRLDIMDQCALAAMGDWESVTEDLGNDPVFSHINEWRPSGTRVLIAAIGDILELHGENSRGDCLTCEDCTYPCRTRRMLADWVTCRHVE